MPRTPRPARGRHALLAILAVFALLLAACGADGGDDEASDDTTTTEEGSSTTKGDDDKGGDDTTTTEGDDGDDGDDGGDDSGGGDADRQAYVDAMMASFAEEDQDVISEDQARCLSEDWVDILDPARLQAAGITPEDLGGDEALDIADTDLDLSDDEANELFDAFGGCDIDLGELMAESFAEDDDLTEEQASCLGDAFTEDVLREFMVASFTGDESGGAAMGQMFAIMGQCGLMDDLGTDDSGD